MKPTYAIARIAVDVLIYVEHDDDHHIGGVPHTPAGGVAWAADTARQMLDSREVQERWDDGGYPLRLAGTELLNLAFMETGEAIDPDWNHHRLEAPDA